MDGPQVPAGDGPSAPSGDGPSVLVVGGGITGLTAAARLAGAGARVTLLEADELGGKVRTRPVAGLPVDTGPDAFLARGPAIAALVADLGLADRVVGPAASGACVWSRGRLRRLPPGTVFGVPRRLWPLLRSGLLSPAGVVRAAGDLVLPRTRLPEDPTVGQVVRPRFGAEVFDRLVQPLLGGVHAGDADLLSARSAVPEVAAVAARSRSLYLGLRARPAPPAPPAGPAGQGAPGTAKEGPARPAPVLVTVAGGLSVLVDALAARLAGATVRTGTTVVAVRPDGDRWTARTADGAEHGADHLVLATPAHASAALLGGPGADAGAGPAKPELLRLAEELAGIGYVGVASVTLAYAPADVPPLPGDATGFLVPPAERRLVVGASWLTAKWAHLADPSVVLVRCLAGRAGDQRWAGMDDAALTRAVHDELVEAMGVRSVPQEALVSRWPAAMPQYTVGHAARLERIDRAAAGLPGLHLAGAAYRGVGLAGCVAQGAAAADAVLAAPARPEVAP